MTNERVYINLQHRQLFHNRFKAEKGKFISDALKNYKSHVIAYAEDSNNYKKIKEYGLKAEEILEDFKLGNDGKGVSVLTLRRKLGFARGKDILNVNTSKFDVDVFCLIMNIKEIDNVIDYNLEPYPEDGELLKSSPSKIDELDQNSFKDSKELKGILAYNKIMTEANKENRAFLKYEDVLVHLIRKMSNPNVKTVTIVSHDLSFVFRMTMTFIRFAMRPGTKLFILFAPSSKYSVFNSTEFQFLYRLGIQAYILPYEYEFLYEGFYFNYDFETKELHSGIEYYELRNKTFFRTSLLDIFFYGSEGGMKTISRAFKDLEDKSQYLIKLKRFNKYLPQRIDEDMYAEWFQKRNLNYPRIGDVVPAYSTFNEAGGKVSFEFRTIDFDQVFFRTNGLTAYKIFQCHQTNYHDMFCEKINDEYHFKPVNLFDNLEFDYYPVNVPILEHNIAEGHYEIADGTSRLFSLWQKNKPKRIRTLTAMIDHPNAFKLKKPYVEDKAKFISNDWNRLIIGDEHAGKHSITECPRIIDSMVTHPYPQKFIADLTKMYEKV